MNILFIKLIMDDIRKPNNKVLLEETLLHIDTIKKDVDIIKSDLKMISQFISKQKKEEELLKNGFKCNAPDTNDGGWWWWL